MGGSDVIGKRIAAALVDIVVVFALFAILAALFGDTHAGDSGAEARLRGGPALLFFALTFAYYWAAEARSGQTLGKRLLGLQVVLADGSPAGTGPTFLRNLLRPIDGLPVLYLLGFVVTLATGDRRQRLGDLAAGTRVVAVDERPSPPPSGPSDEDIMAQVLHR